MRKTASLPGIANGADRLAPGRLIEDERAFRRRFGYGFNWPRRHREALIQLKHEMDLTDAEIKLFRHTGNLRRTAFGVQLNASGWMAAFGWVQITLFSVLFGIPIMLACVSFTGSPNQALRIGLVSTGLVGLCFGIYLVYVQPWVIQRRAKSPGAPVQN